MRYVMEEKLHCLLNCEDYPCFVSDQLHFFEYSKVLILKKVILTTIYFPTSLQVVGFFS